MATIKSISGNLFMAQRLELMAKLEGHSGCVNSVNFNDAGDLLVSGSDDLHCMMWEWQRFVSRRFGAILISLVVHR